MPERREKSTGIKIGGSLKREVMTWEICKTLLESAYFLGMRVKAVQTNFLSISKSCVTFDTLVAV